MKNRETRQSRKRRREELIAQATRERQDRPSGPDQTGSRAKSQAPTSERSARDAAGNATSKTGKLPLPD
jgi:hypothetical protein